MMSGVILSGSASLRHEQTQSTDQEAETLFQNWGIYKTLSLILWPYNWQLLLLYERFHDFPKQFHYRGTTIQAHRSSGDI